MSTYQLESRPGKVQAREPKPIRHAVLALVAVLLCQTSLFAQTVFEQDFSQGSDPSTYVGNGPNQFNAISSTTGVAFSIDNGTLLGTRAGAGTGAATRSSDLPTATGAIYQFDINVTDITAPSATSLAFYAGSGFTTANSAPALPNIHSRFSIDFENSATDTYAFRNIGVGNGPTTFTGTSSVFFVVNNSGSAVTYLSPSGIPVTIANDTFDLYVNGIQQFNDVAATTGTVDPTDFKLVFGAGSGTVRLDNFEVSQLSSIPEPGTVVMAFALVGLVACRERRRFAGLWKAVGSGQQDT